MQKVWIAGNFIDGHGDRGTVWRLLGVFSAEAIAEDACFDNYCFVAEIPLNQELNQKLDASVFENMRYPKRNMRPLAQHATSSASRAKR